ncbi:MAG: NADH-quinone oxidoreductase subunit C [Pseudomonadota bacterium]
MTAKAEKLLAALQIRFADLPAEFLIANGEVTLEVAAESYLELCTALRDEEDFSFEQLIDLCGVDYSQYGRDEWTTNESSSTGFSRGVEGGSSGRLTFGDELDATVEDSRRFAAVLHLLSYKNNQRVRVRVYTADAAFPVVPSVTAIWNGADWYEREAFDLYGILFEGHNDLRRILTDYGFVGHPFRKDFPLVGHVEMRYDPEKGRVVYEPVTIDPRVLVPKVVRDDNRYIEPSDVQAQEAAS